MMQPGCIAIHPHNYFPCLLPSFRSLLSQNKRKG